MLRILKRAALRLRNLKCAMARVTEQRPCVLVCILFSSLVLHITAIPPLEAPEPGSWLGWGDCYEQRLQEIQRIDADSKVNRFTLKQFPES